MRGDELLEILRDQTEEAAFQRGASYFQTGRVHSRRRRGGRLSARVRGRRNYGVTLQAEPSAISGYCSCPCFAGGKFCQHVVALAQAWAREPDSFIDLDLMREKIFRQERELLAEIVARVVEIYPDLIEDMGLNVRDGREFDAAVVMRQILAGSDPLDSTEMDLVVRRMKSVHARADVERHRGFAGTSRRILFEMIHAALEMDRQFESAEIFPRGFLAHLYAEYRQLATDAPPVEINPGPDDDEQLRSHPWFVAEGLDRIAAALESRADE